METIKSLISFILIFSLIIPSSTGFSQAVIDDELDDSNPYTPAAGVMCTGQEEIPTPTVPCCTGLELNPSSGKCDEIVFSDPALTSCSGNQNCGSGTGCYPQRASDLFSTLSSGGEDSDLMSMVDAQISDEGENPNGAPCMHSRECQSYSCVNKVCEYKTVCRYAGEGELAPSGVSCGTDLVKAPNGICEQSPDAKNRVYLGLLNQVTIEPKGQCQFVLDPDTREKSIIAMKSLRAMEWLLANISITEEDECFKTIPRLKDVVGKTFVETRKNILTNFTDVLNEIETDFQTLVNAKEKSSKVVVMNGVQMTEDELATRQTSGYDSLMIMYRRNLLFQSYEKAMLETVKVANKSIADLSVGQESWKDADTSWKVGDTTIEQYNCKSKYKKWKPFSWVTKYYKETKDRWTYYYEVTGSAAGNADIVTRPKVADHLALIGGMSPQDAIADLTKSKYYLLDPLMHGGLRFDQYGQKKKLSKGGFLGLGKKDLRFARFLKGDANGSYTAMYNALRPKVKEFYSSLKANQGQKNFVYEPELMTVEAKDCIASPGNKGCDTFEPFLEEVLDQGFAQFLAYSAASKDSYTGYFTNATTWRRKLLAKLEVDMQNISKYYDTVIKHRDEQNTCIENVINGVIESGILSYGKDPGIVEGDGNGNNFATKGVRSAVSNITTQGKVTKPTLSRLSSLSRTQFQFDLLTNSHKNLNKGTLKDSMGNTNSADRAGVGGQSSASALAARNASMKNANLKAKAAGVKFSEKENAILSSIKATGGGTQAQSFKNDGTLASSLSPQVITNNKKATVGQQNAAESTQEIREINASSGASGTPMKGSNPLSESALIGSGQNSNEVVSDSDGTGLSENEQDSMIASVEKNRSEYQAFEDDTLFNKVSKAYVRNLDKVLKKKKVVNEK